ncbi:hypothetical protein BDZ45DRAFT_243510 [Acephala macrosclerotiorum]|nr:hypothetical protein BDZ45DRAFT_243510 [Acephala macrosclerotiorum]
MPPQEAQAFNGGPISGRRSCSTSSHRRKRYSPQRRIQVAKVRKAGACPSCRRKKVGCTHALQTGLRPSLDSQSRSPEEGVHPTSQHIISEVDLDVVPELPYFSTTPLPEQTQPGFLDAPPTMTPPNPAMWDMARQSQPLATMPTDETWKKPPARMVYGASTRTLHHHAGVEGSPLDNDRTFGEDGYFSLDTTPSFPWIYPSGSYQLPLYDEQGLPFRNSSGYMASAPYDTYSADNTSTSCANTTLSIDNTYYVEGSTGADVYGHVSMPKPEDTSQSRPLSSTNAPP